MLVDSHCHLDFPELREDLPGVLERMRENGVSHALTISTTRVLNVAHGVFFVWGGATFVILSQRLRLHPALAIVILTGLFFVLALLFERGIVRTLLGRSHRMLLVGSIMATTISTEQIEVRVIELISAAGVNEEFVRSLEEFGLIAAEAGRFRPEDVQIVAAAFIPVLACGSHW